MRPGPDNKSYFFCTRPATRFAKTHFDKIDTIVEVGVFWGNNARLMWWHLNPRMMYLVDPYEPYKEGSPSNEKWDWNRQVATFATAIIPCERIFLPSIRASGFVPSGLDMVYLDGAHDYENVCADIRCWWKKVRVGGLLCGHDYNNDDCPGVARAVNELLPGADHKDCDWWIVKETQDEA